MNNLFAALLICVAAAVFEGICAGREPLKKLAQLRQPSWSPPVWLWVVIGLLWYGICFTALVRLLPHYSTDPTPVRLLAVLMAVNAFSNVFLFRIGRLDLACLIFGPYWLVLAAFIATALPVDGLSSGLFVIYAAYQSYAALWGWGLWTLNGKRAPYRPVR